MVHLSENENKLTLKQLYPKLNENEMQLAGEAIDQYLQLALRIWQRLKEQPTEQLRFSSLDKVTVQREDRAT